MGATGEREEEETFYDRVGGHATFVTLLHRFFVALKADPLVAPLYPADDWDGAEKRLLMFFEQYWGGPLTYSLTRGSPMLKMRHMPYKVSESAKDAWLRHFHAAIDTIELSLEDEFLLRDYIERAARYLVNYDE